MPSSVTVTTAPVTGNAVANASGTITYTAPAHWSGSETFTYTVTGVAGLTATATVTITVDPPAAHGTMMVIGFVGFHCCADAAGATANDSTAAIPVTSNVRLLRSIRSSP